MNRERPRISVRASERGAALVTSLLTVVGIATLGAWVIQTQAAVAQRQRLSIDTKSALYVAEAGLAEAAFQVSLGKSGAIGSEESPARFGDGVYWVEAEPRDGHEVALTATARAGSSQFRIQLRIVPNQNPVSRLGVFGDEGVTVGDRVLVDGYDAALDVIEKQYGAGPTDYTTGAGGLVGSNGDIVLLDGTTALDTFGAYVRATGVPDRPGGLRKLDPALADRLDHADAGTWIASTLIAGDLMPGPDGVVITNGTASLQRTAQRAERAILPEVVLPSQLTPTTTDYVVAAGTMQRIEDITERVRGIRVEAGATLVLKGPIVAQAESLVVQSGGLVEFDARKGPIAIYCTDELRFELGSAISDKDESRKGHGTSILVPRPADPADDARVRLDAVGDYHGILYAPGDRVTIPPGLRLYGSVVAKYVTVESGAWLSHDASLEVGGSAFPALPKRRRWQPVPLAGPLVGPAGADPVLSARLAGTPAGPGPLLTPETDLEVLYMDLDGNKAEYVGPFSDLDLSIVERIQAVRWMNPRTNQYEDWTQPAGASPDDVVGRWRRNLRAARADERAADPGP